MFDNTTRWTPGAIHGELQIQTKSLGRQIGEAFYRNDGLRASVLGVIVIVSVFGFVANSINLLIFSKLWSKDTVNISLFGIALSDFMVCITSIGAALCEFPWIQRILLYQFDTNPSELSYYFFGIPHKICERTTLIITAFIMIERCVCVTFPLKVRRIITRERVYFAVMLCYLLAISTGIPIYCTRYHAWVFYPTLNRTIYSVLKTENYDAVNAIVAPITVFLFYICLFIVIVIATSILIITLQKKSSWRQKATSAGKESSSSSSSGENTNISSKETKISKMLTMVASLFIGCNIPCTAIFLLFYLDPSFRIHGANAHFYLMMTYISFLFVGINSSFNALIYYKNSSNYKEAFDKTFACIQRQEKLETDH